MIRLGAAVGLSLAVHGGVAVAVLARATDVETRPPVLFIVPSFEHQGERRAEPGPDPQAEMARDRSSLEAAVTGARTSPPTRADADIGSLLFDASAAPPRPRDRGHSEAVLEKVSGLVALAAPGRPTPQTHEAAVGRSGSAFAPVATPPHLDDALEDPPPPNPVERESVDPVVMSSWPPAEPAPIGAEPAPSVDRAAARPAVVDRRRVEGRSDLEPAALGKGPWASRSLTDRARDEAGGPLAAAPPDVVADAEIRWAPSREGKSVPEAGGERFARTSPTLPQALTGPRYDRAAKPAYPWQARLRGEEGLVLLAVTVSPEGAVTDVRVAQSSGSRRLDEAAVSAVKGWRFHPARRGAEAVEGVVHVPVTFRLEDR